MGCVAVWEQEEEEAKADVILPPDILDTALAMLCAPLIIRHAEDLRGREAHFQCPTATVRMHTMDAEVEEALRRMTADMPGGGLSVTMKLEEAVTELRDSFMEGWKNGKGWKALGRLDLGRTTLRRIGNNFPPSLTEVGENFVRECRSLQRLDMGHTAVHTVGAYCAAHCSKTL